MLLTELAYGVDPIGVLAVVGIDVGFVLVVVQFRHIGGFLLGVEVGLLQHHGVAVTVEHLVAIGLPSAIELIGEGDVGLTLVTTAEFDFDDTVGTLGTPLGGRTVLEDLDALDVFGVDIQQGGELFLVVEVAEVNVLDGIFRKFEDVVVDDNQGLRITVDGGGTAQTHRGTGTEVTGVLHDVETCNLTLQGLIDGFEGHTFHLVHVEGLCGTRQLTDGDAEAAGLLAFLGSNLHLGHRLGVVL